MCQHSGEPLCSPEINVNLNFTNAGRYATYRRQTDSHKGCPYKCYCKINVTGRVTRPLRNGRYFCFAKSIYFLAKIRYVLRTRYALRAIKTGKGNALPKLFTLHHSLFTNLIYSAVRGFRADGIRPYAKTLLTFSGKFVKIILTS